MQHVASAYARQDIEGCKRNALKASGENVDAPKQNCAPADVGNSKVAEAIV